MDKHTYLVAEGVPFVNGSAVPDNRRVALTAAEAVFDLAHERITLVVEAPEEGEAASRRRR